MIPSITPLQLTLAAVLAILAVIPSVMILRRLGYSGWWAILAVHFTHQYHRPLDSRYCAMANRTTGSNP